MEREPIILDVYGLPTPQGSKKLIHGRIIEASSAKLQKWRKEVQDKRVRGVGDALTYGEVWGDDSQVVSMVCHKRYADDREPGAEIEIHSVTI